MLMYSLTKFAQTYSTHFCWFFRSVRKNSRNPSLEAPKNANAHEHPATAAAFISASVQECRRDCNLNCRQPSLWTDRSDAQTVG
jgi:hypothetical protein